MLSRFVILAHFDVTYLLIFPLFVPFSTWRKISYARNCFLEIKACGNISILNGMEWNETKMKLSTLKISMSLCILHLASFIACITSVYVHVVPCFYFHASQEYIYIRARQRIHAIFWLFTRIRRSFMAQRRFISSKTTIYRHEKQALI